MCGIAVAHDREVVERMLEVLEHRGHDGRVIGEYHGLFVGHNRLAIVDVGEDGIQPVETAYGMLAFVGEIYNYLQLYGMLNKRRPERELETATLLEVVHQHREFWRLLDGMYNIIYVDKGRERLIVSRDLYGIIPCYYTRNPFMVASEKKALIAITSAPIHEVRAGETLTFSIKGRLLRRDRFDPFGMRAEMIDYDHLENLFRRAVEKQTFHSERPVCVALSGGLDSSMVLQAARDADLNIEAVTVVRDSNSVECQNAVRFCKQLGVRHEVVVVDDAMIEAERERILYYLEDPVTNPIKYGAMIRNYFVAKHAPGVVILCGEGADEFGCSYPSHLKEDGLALEWKSLSTVRSMPAINLDRVNKGGMAWTREYRPPFLDTALSLYMLACRKSPGKHYYKILAARMGVPDYIIEKQKYTEEEADIRRLTATWGDANGR